MDKTQAQVQAQLEAGQYYEAHQAVRTVVARQVRQKKYDDAIRTLTTGAEQMLRANQPGSASDLTLYLLSIYDKAQIKVDSVSRARLVGLLQAFPPTEPTLKKMGAEASAWAARHGALAFGDPELNHVLGCVFAQTNDIYTCERYLLLGTRESAEVLGNVLFEWYRDQEMHNLDMAALFVSRGVLGYLSIGNIRDANKCVQTFLNRVSDPYETIVDDKTGFELRLFADTPFLNFVQLLVLASLYHNADLYKRLQIRYQAVTERFEALKPVLEKIGQTVFGVVVAPAANPLADLMGSFFK